MVFTCQMPALAFGAISLQSTNYSTETLHYIGISLHSNDIILEMIVG
jgi:hypothetical protein